MHFNTINAHLDKLRVMRHDLEDLKERYSEFENVVLDLQDAQRMLQSATDRITYLPFNRHKES